MKAFVLAPTCGPLFLLPFKIFQNAQFHCAFYQWKSGQTSLFILNYNVCHKNAQMADIQALKDVLGRLCRIFRELVMKSLD